MAEIQFFNYKTQQGDKKLKFLPPNICPNCKAGVANVPKCGEVIKGQNSIAKKFATITHCHACNCLFFTEYILHNDDAYHEYDTYPKTPNKPTPFPEYIETTYPNFVKIYREAEKAEQNGLKEICGVGYRKAVEFLVKDYLMYKIDTSDLNNEEKTAEKNAIKKRPLSPCISAIQNEAIRKVAIKSTWLGNDETHYERTYEDRDLDDLKHFMNALVKLIDLEHTIEEDL